MAACAETRVSKSSAREAAPVVDNVPAAATITTRAIIPDLDMFAPQPSEARCRPDPHDRANGGTLAGRFAHEVTVRYPSRSCFGNGDGGVRVVPFGHGQPPAVARGRARLHDPEGIRPAALPGRAP